MTNRGSQTDPTPIEAPTDPLAHVSFARGTDRARGDSGTDSSARFTVFVSAAVLGGVAV